MLFFNTNILKNTNKKIMSNKRELVLPILLLVLLGTVSLYVPVKYLGDFLFYRSLKANGIRTTAEITDKGIIRAGKFVQARDSSASDRHVFKLIYISLNNEEQVCDAVVSKNLYDSSSVSDTIEVVYSKSESNKCLLPENAQSLYLLSLVTICFGALFLLIFLALAFHIYKSFKRRDNPVKLSTGFSDKIVCPECGSEMAEGYIPGVGGINWRERNAPIGLPNMLTGLPGTIFWVKRPILHAFNCRNCRVVTFRYGK